MTGRPGSASVRRRTLACLLIAANFGTAPAKAFGWPISSATQRRHSAPLRVNRAISDLYASTMNAMWFGEAGSVCNAFTSRGARALVRAVRDGSELGNGWNYGDLPSTCLEAAGDIFQSVRFGQWNWTYADWRRFIARDVRGAVITGAVSAHRARLDVPAALERGRQTLLRTRHGWLFDAPDPKGGIGPIVFDETDQLL